VVVQLLTYSTVNYDGSPWRRVDDALRRAAARGVKVRMNLSDWNKRKPLVESIKALVRLPGIAIKLNTIPRHSSGFIPYARVDHCKYMVVDGKLGWLGTSNWSGDYFDSSRNVDLVFRDPRVVAQLARIFEQGWAGPYAYDLDPDVDYPPPRRE
jgi:phosphatidylserine/phosphatidylglycerophosphate/cardiolipin synthase-like enzyme